MPALSSPDPYGKQIDGLGNASQCQQAAWPRCVDYLFGPVIIDQPLVDWSGNCGNLSAAVGPCASYTAPSGKQIDGGDIDLLVRALSIGKPHHAMMGTAAVAIVVAAAIPGTCVNLAATGEVGSSNGQRQSVRFGHPSGTLRVGAEAQPDTNGQWQVTKALMGRSARIFIEGWVRVPGDMLGA